MTNYDRHRALAEARRIEWNGQVLTYSPNLVSQLLLAKDAMLPDGPFAPKAEEARVVIGNEVMTVRRGEVEELLDLARAASVQEMMVINGVRANTEKGAL